MPRRDRLSSSAYRRAALGRAAKVILGSPVKTVDYPGGRSRESCLLTLADGRRVIGTRRDTIARARRESAILDALTRRGARAPRLLGTNRAQILFQEALEGERLSRAIVDARDDEARLEALLDASLEGLAGIHAAATAEGLERRVTTLGDSRAWRARLVERPGVLGEYLEVAAPELDTEAIVETLAVREPRFIKWDSRPGNALVDADGAVHWFDWEHAGRRNRLDDLVWVLGDEFVPDAAAVEARLLERHVPRFADVFTESEAREYVAVYGSLHLAVRLGLILKHVDGRWWDLDRCIEEDRVGVTLDGARSLCRRGARWAETSALVAPLARWFADCEPRIEALVPESEAVDGTAPARSA